MMENSLSFSREQIAQFEKRFRTQFINALSGVKSANLIGTIDKAGNTNLSIVSSIVHLGAQPPLIGMVMRPASVPRNTYENIRDTGVFTVNHVNESIYRQAHQTSARYDKDVCEFTETGLTKHFLPVSIAPFVQESKLKFACELKEDIFIHHNQTHFLVAEIVTVIAPEKSISPDGSIRLYDHSTVGVVGLDTYVSLTKLERLSYAKPFVPLKPLD